MGQQHGKFQGKGHVLGTKEAPPPPPPPAAAKPRPASITKTLFPAKKSPNKPKTPEELARAQQLLAEKREAAASAALARTKAWDERVNKFKAKQVAEASSAAPGLKWNESSLSANAANLPPLDPELVRKQQEAREQLTKSGFNPYQATMSSSNSARNAIDNMTLPSTPPLTPAARMAQSRTRLLQAMAGSNVEELVAAITNAAVFDVPEVEEAKEIYLALLDQQEQQQQQEEEEEVLLDFAFIQRLVYDFAQGQGAAAQTDLETRRLAKSTLLTILGNLVQSPHEAKFRKIRLANKQIQERIVKPHGCIPILEAVGFVHAVDEQNGEACMMVPDPSTVSKDEVEYARQACLAAINSLNATSL